MARFDPDIEAALLRVFGVDPMNQSTTLRRIWTLCQRLPAGTLPDEKLSGPAAWSLEAHLLATVADQVAYLTYVTARVNGGKSARKPKPIPRPKARPGTPAAANGDGSNGRKVKWAELGDALTGTRGMVNRG